MEWIIEMYKRAKVSNRDTVEEHNDDDGKQSRVSAMRVRYRLARYSYAAATFVGWKGVS